MSYQLQSCVARDMMDYAQAQEAYRKAYQVAKELGDAELIGSALARQGVAFIQQDKPTNLAQSSWRKERCIARLGAVLSI